MRAALAALAAASLLALALPAAARFVPDPFPGAAAGYLVLADGKPLWAGNADVPLPPASLTKVMTALLVAESVPADAVVTVSANAARAGGARMGLARGARVRAGDLVAGMMLRSGNDACVALAEHVAGSEAAFVARMNARAREWGLTATSFANACGFDAPGHHASARDLAALAKRLLANPALAELVASERRTARSLDGRTFDLRNTNLLLGLVQGLAGVKTGTTARAGYCLVAYAKRGTHDVLVVLLRGSDRWWDAVAMIERAFVRLEPEPPLPR